MKNENLVPKVRFKGFSDPWEQRKLGNYVIIKSGDAPSEFVDGDEPYLKVDDLNNSTVFQNSTKHTVKGNAEKMIQSGSIVFSKRGAAILTNKVRILEKKMFMDTNMMALTPVETDLYFLYFLISEENLSKIADTSTIPQINNKHIIPYTIYLPCLMEQQRLGKVLILLSNLIAANEDKLEQLKTLKKLMMQKIFSQEWRFKGFTDPWEQRKLKWFLRVSKLKNIDGIFDKNSVLSVSGEFGVVNQIAFQGRSFAGKSILNYGILDHNDVVYTKSPLKSNPYGIIKTNLGKAGVVSTLYAVYAPLKTVYSPILGYYFNLDTRVNNYLRPLVNKGAKNDMKVRDEAVLEGKVCIPDSIETQKRICNLFSLINNLIAANEDKLNQLKELKKYLMQNMFV
ncbi:restriction endonuclease subunit S [Lactiplantibacillus plantarum]|uniref:restriction endonuclease subunit S n=2 Tax=Lactiplantibacillus plantarum TaxID=1590 RepID=UPI0007ABA4C2|nr:restriction endonuclease subunit S [Lactiplantibacillus plantarum]KZD97755.1 Type I restriction-modification system specificity subunit S [Lactiplantibacillus plantarum]